MSQIALTPNANGTGTLTIAAPNTNTNRTLTLPDASGTLIHADASGSVELDAVRITNEIRFQGAATALSLVQKNPGTGRDELQIYSAGDAYSTGSKGAGMHLYGNSDFEHAGNIAFMTGQDNQGDARMIISGGSNNVSSGGYRTNTDTRVTIGNSIFDFVDTLQDTALLNLKNPQGRPAICFFETSDSEGELAIPDSENFSMGHWSGTTFTPRLQFNSTGAVTIANLAGSGTRTVTASSTGLLAASSDSRLKQEVQVSSIAGLAEIMQLRPVAYKWLDDIDKLGDDASVELGFFADEVKDVIPSAAPMGIDGYYGFYDRAVLAVLTKAIQEQQAIITALEARITVLEAN
jgi:hypothetical protein